MTDIQARQSWKWQMIGDELLAYRVGFVGAVSQEDFVYIIMLTKNQYQNSVYATYVAPKTPDSRASTTGWFLTREAESFEEAERAAIRHHVMETQKGAVLLK